jgi:putative intracellular protease/amidase
MARVLMPLPERDFDPSEAAVTWSILKDLGHMVTFATPGGKPSEADDIMISGHGLDPWAAIPALEKFAFIGLFLRADGVARRAYGEMVLDAAFRTPVNWDEARAQDFDGLFVPGGHRARGMRGFLESSVLQALVADFMKANKPVAAVCHGVLLVARSIDPETGKSVLYGRKTTALTWALENSARRLARVARWWDPNYYSTYPDGAGDPVGFRGTEAEVTRLIARRDDFEDVPLGSPDYWRKTSGLVRDRLTDSRPAFVVEDGNYLSGRWPGDIHTLAQRFAAKLPPAAA